MSSPDRVNGRTLPCPGASGRLPPLPPHVCVRRHKAVQAKATVGKRGSPSSEETQTHEGQVQTASHVGEPRVQRRRRETTWGNRRAGGRWAAWEARLLSAHELPAAVFSTVCGGQPLPTCLSYGACFRSLLPEGLLRVTSFLKDPFRGSCFKSNPNGGWRVAHQHQNCRGPILSPASRTTSLCLCPDFVRKDTPNYTLAPIGPGGLDPNSEYLSACIATRKQRLMGKSMCW